MVGKPTYCLSSFGSSSYVDIIVNNNTFCSDFMSGVEMKIFDRMFVQRLCDFLRYAP